MLKTTSSSGCTSAVFHQTVKTATCACKLGLPCKQVAQIVACRHKVETCDEASRGAAEVWDKEQATLWGSDKERPQR